MRGGPIDLLDYLRTLGALARPVGSMTLATSSDDWKHQTASLRRLARALVGNSPDADDLVQEALLAGWLAAHRRSRECGLASERCAEPRH